MKLEMMAIFDQAAKAFLPPFCVASEAIALRQLRALGQEQPKHDFVRFSDQYTLYFLGTFDNESGKVFATGPSSLGTLQVIFSLGELPLEAKE